MKTIVWTGLFAVVLSACGGGGGGSSASGLSALATTPPPAAATTSPPEQAPKEVASQEPAPSSTPETSTPQAPAAARVLSYKVVPQLVSLPAPGSPSEDTFLVQLNDEGRQGWRYIGAVTFDNGSSLRTGLGFVKEGGATHSYKRRPYTTDRVALEAQLNEEGALGFRYAGRGNIYVQTTANTSTFSYRVLLAAPGATESSAELVAQASAQGADGYRLLGTTLALGSDKVRIYERESQSTSTYGYEALAYVAAADGTDGEVMQQNILGARGFRFKAVHDFGAEGKLLIYERDLAQSSRFLFHLRSGVTDEMAFMTQANEEGALGHVLAGSHAYPWGLTNTLYFTATNCNGALCHTSEPYLSPSDSFFVPPAR